MYEVKFTKYIKIHQPNCYIKTHKPDKIGIAVLGLNKDICVFLVTRSYLENYSGPTVYSGFRFLFSNFRPKRQIFIEKNENKSWLHQHTFFTNGDLKHILVHLTSLRPSILELRTSSSCCPDSSCFNMCSFRSFSRKYLPRMSWSCRRETGNVHVVIVVCASWLG